MVKFILIQFLIFLGGSKYYLDKTPYIIGSILLEENVRIMSNIITDDIKSVEIGKR